MKRPYSEKLRDPRWQKVRLKVFERDAWTCQACYDDQTTLNVHHHYYIHGAEPWEAPLDALVTLCETCHRDVGGIAREIGLTDTTSLLVGAING